MSFTYSVAYGLIGGLFTYVLLNGLIYVTKKSSIGRIVPPDADAAEYWTYKPGGHPPWFIRAVHGRLWRTGSYEDVGARLGVSSMIEGLKRVRKNLLKRLERVGRECILQNSVMA
jgi:hypothetical protein